MTERRPSGWLDDETWLLVQRSVPIVCVDAVIVDGGGRVLLIERLAPSGMAWCLIGGRVRLDETLVGAVDRHVLETIGRVVPVTSAPAVVEYPRVAAAGAFDPRQHAVAMTYLASLEGVEADELTAGGEALALGWFAATALPTMGFGQDHVVRRVLGQGS